MAKSRKRGRTTSRPSVKKRLARVEASKYHPYSVPVPAERRAKTAPGADVVRSRMRPRVGVALVLRKAGTRRVRRALLSPLYKGLVLRGPLAPPPSKKAVRSVCTKRLKRREAIFASNKQGRGSHGSYRRTPESKEKC